MQLTLPRRYWQLRRDRARIPHHPGRVRKSLFATSSDVPERHEDVISDGGFPKALRRCSRGTRSISGSREVHTKPWANFVGDSHLQVELDGAW